MSLGFRIYNLDNVFTRSSEESMEKSNVMLYTILKFIEEELKHGGKKI